MSYIKVKQVSKHYQVGTTQIHALNNINFEIEQGEFVVILGPSGSGKTTLLNILGGMDSPSQGSVVIDEQSIDELNAKKLGLYRRNSIGFVFQFYNLIPTLTAYENIKLSERISKHPFSAHEILQKVGLENRKNNLPQELSGGEQQRISIARAVCKNPQLILCDEPTGALDSDTGRQILKLLKELANKNNQTIIVVTHNALIAEIADRVIRLKDGQIINNQVQINPLNVDEVSW